MIKIKSVPFNYLPYEFKDPSKIIKEWKKLIKTTDFTLGFFVNEFEAIFAKYIGVKYCIVEIFEDLINALANPETNLCSK